MLKVFLPPFTVFLIFFLLIRYSGVYFSLKDDEMGAGDLLSFLTFFRYMFPLLFVVAVLTQGLVAIPIWRYLQSKSGVMKVAVSLDLALLCFLIATIIAFIIWDRNLGLVHLAKVISFMTLIQLFYWLINILILNWLKK